LIFKRAQSAGVMNFGIILKTAVDPHPPVLILQKSPQFIKIYNFKSRQFLLVADKEVFL
jgi:hypothetical protein